MGVREFNQDVNNFYPVTQRWGKMEGYMHEKDDLNYKQISFKVPLWSEERKLTSPKKQMQLASLEDQLGLVISFLLLLLQRIVRCCRLL